MNTIELANAIHEAKKTIESKPESDAAGVINNLLWWISEFGRELEAERLACASSLDLLKRNLAPGQAPVPAAREVTFEQVNEACRHIYGLRHWHQSERDRVESALRSTQPSTPQDSAPVAVVSDPDLRSLVKRVHKAKGRYQIELAMCDLFDACGLPNVRPGQEPLPQHAVPAVAVGAVTCYIHRDQLRRMQERVQTDDADATVRYFNGFPNWVSPELQKNWIALSATPPVVQLVAWTGSGSIAAIKAGQEGFIWGSSAEAHPIPLYAAPAGVPPTLVLDGKDARAQSIKDLANMHHDAVVVMQTAWIDWRRGAGADSAMQWIENTLSGPGLIPGDDEPYSSEPQAYFDKNKSDPFPPCFCGRPSNQLWMGEGFCGEAHYKERRAILASEPGGEG